MPSTSGTRGLLFNQGYYKRLNYCYRIRCLDWNPLGTLIASGSADRTLRVWNPDRPNVRYSTELKGHDASIEKVAFNPVKDAELCSLSADGVLKLWDVRTKTCINEIKGLGSAVSLVWHPDGEGIIVGNKVCQRTTDCMLISNTFFRRTISSS